MNRRAAAGAAGDRDRGRGCRAACRRSRRGCGVVAERGARRLGVAAGLDGVADHRAHGHGVALGVRLVDEDAGERRLDLHRRLVGLDLEQRIALGERRVRTHEPLPHDHLVGAERDLRHVDLPHATASISARSAVPSDRADGKMRGSRSGLYGAGA